MTHGSAHFPNNLYGIPQKQTGQFCTFKLGQVLKYPIMLTDLAMSVGGQFGPLHCAGLYTALIW